MTNKSKKWPKHVNPPIDRMASAPYNFIPLPEKVVPAVNGVLDLPGHDKYEEGKHTGYFEVSLMTRSPLYIRCPLKVEDFLRQEKAIKSKSEEKDDEKKLSFREEVKNIPHFFYTKDPSKPVIPGSSLRGMLRTLLEIVSYGKIVKVGRQDKIFYRAVAAERDDPLKNPYQEIIGKNGRNVRSGYLVKRDENWYIRPAKRPSDFGWPERCSYIRVRRNKVEGKIPNLIPFNSDQYKPQYHSVSFDVKIVGGRRDKLFRINKIGPLNKGYPFKGVLVCTGNMKETGDDKTESPRTTYALVLEEDKSKRLIKINEQAVEDYLDALTPFQTELPFSQKTGCLIEGRPVFYVEKDGEVICFGHCPNFRVPALSEGQRRASTPLDFIPEELRRPEVIDYAEALFGFIRDNEEIETIQKHGLLEGQMQQGDKWRAYAGRVFVTDAYLEEGQTDIWWSKEPIVPKILASPKPTAFQHYLVQTGSKKDELKHYGSKTPDDTVIRGHKRYWLQGERKLEDIKEEESEVSNDSTQHTQFRPVKPGVKFKFRIYFENLSDRELGALCWILHPPGDPQKKYCHQVGMAKPFGMGAVKLDARLYLTDRYKRYTALFEGSSWQTGVAKAGEALSERSTLERRAEAFETHVLEELGLKQNCDHLREVERIAMLLKMMEWPGYPSVPAPAKPYLNEEDRPNTRYMSIQLEEYKDRPILPDPSVFG